MDGQMTATLNIAVAGLGYVALANAVLLAQNHRVTAIDVAQERVYTAANRQSPIVDAECLTEDRTRSLSQTVRNFLHHGRQPQKKPAS